MPFHFELYTDRPVLINIFEEHLEPEEIPAMVDELNAWLARLDHKVYYINVLGTTHLSLGDVMQGVQLAARGDASPLHHPNIIETLVITADPFILMAARTINSYVFGNVKLKTFTTLDEALSYIDAKNASSVTLE